MSGQGADDRAEALVTEAAAVHVLLDVDGVINAVRYGTKPRDGWERHEKYKHIFGRYEGAPFTGNAAFTIRYSPDLVDALNDLAERTHMHWLTTWLDEARYGLAPRIGLLEGGEWPVLGRKEHRAGRHGWWKLDAAKAHVEANPEARIVWIDDDLLDSEAIEWIESVAPKVLPVRPDSEVGLTPQQVADINAWVNEVTAGPNPDPATPPPNPPAALEESR